MGFQDPREIRTDESARNEPAGRKRGSSILLRSSSERDGGNLQIFAKNVGKDRVEALVLDPIQFFVELAAMKLRIPYVTVANALYIDFSGYTPAGIFG
jgi:hypothetical protein